MMKKWYEKKSEKCTKLLSNLHCSDVKLPEMKFMKNPVIIGGSGNKKSTLFVT